MGRTIPSYPNYNRKNKKTEPCASESFNYLNVSYYPPDFRLEYFINYTTKSILNGIK